MREVKPFLTHSHLVDAVNFSFDKCGVLDGDIEQVSRDESI